MNGLTASQAQSQGLVEDYSDAEYASDANSESLFVDGDSETEQRPPRSRSGSPLKTEVMTMAPKHAPSTTPFQSTGVFGQPSTKPNPFLPPKTTNPHQPPPFGFSTTFTLQPGDDPFAKKETPPINPFQKRPESTIQSAPPKANPFATSTAPPFNPFQKQSTSSSSSQSNSLTTPASTVQERSSTFNFPPSTGNNQVSNNLGQKSQPSAPGIFGQPSSSISKASSQATATTASAPAFSWPKPCTNVQEPSVENIDGNTLSFNHQTDSKEAQKPEAPKVSFGTSPFFQSSPSGAQPTSNKPETSRLQTQKPLFPFNPPTQPSTSTPALPKQSAESTATATPAISRSFPPTSFTPQQPLPPAFSSAMETPNSRNAQPSFPLTDHLASTKDSTAARFPSSHTPLSPTGHPTPIQPNSAKGAQPTSKDSPNKFTSQSSLQKPDPRPQALDQLTEILMTEDGGLLQQFVEFSVAPIIRSSIIKFQDEKSWSRASRWPIDLSLIILQKLIVDRGVSCLFAS